MLYIKMLYVKKSISKFQTILNLYGNFSTSKLLKDGTKKADQFKLHEFGEKYLGKKQV
jgi:hypothetical protein